MKTLISEHWGGQVRGTTWNTPTRVVHVASVRALPLRTLFERAYPTFASRCREVEQPGLAIIAVDETTGTPMGMVCLRAQVDRHVTAIIGRHDRCDLYLPSNERLALRHLAFILGPVTDWRANTSAVSFRVLDLRTDVGMVDEESRPLRALRSEGPAMMRCGGHAIFALPVGDPTDWPATAVDAWTQLPERVYHDELVRVPDASCLRPRVAADRGQITLVTRIAGPRDLTGPLRSGDELAGRLWIQGVTGERTLEVGRHALRDGVLLGRYDRCDVHGLDLGDSVSRVHALLVHVDDRLLAIDIASTNGTRLASADDARVIEVAHDTVVELGVSTLVRWRWTS